VTLRFGTNEQGQMTTISNRLASNLLRVDITLQSATIKLGLCNVFRNK